MSNDKESGLFGFLNEQILVDLLEKLSKNSNEPTIMQDINFKIAQSVIGNILS